VQTSLTLGIGTDLFRSPSPQCVPFGVTAEGNNLNFGPCCVLSTPTRMRFLESNASPMPSSPLCLLTEITAIQLPLRF
jgi:hypothetical protein